MKKIPPADSGLTILELMIAIFVFSIASYSLIYGLSTGDKIGGRANASHAAAILASNEAERIRHAALHGVQSPDSSYMEIVSGGKYAVSRKNITQPDTGLENKALAEFEIRVEPQRAFSTPYIFKLVQGCHQ